MFARLIYRLVHFLIYAVLFLKRKIAYKMQRMRNTFRWNLSLMLSGFAAQETILARTCVTGKLLGAKKLNHVALIVNELHKDVNLPT